MDEWYIALPVTIALVGLSAFFVIVEFSLLVVRRHRLEATAETSAVSRAGLRSLNELTVMLAGAQLGITACTFALGAVTKPWVKQGFVSLLGTTPLPQGVSDAASFVLALIVVTFLHLVIGEMAPKSWAITHPESALRFVALPARAFTNLFRPLLSWINRIANRLVVVAGEQPVERAIARGYDAESLRILVEHSRGAGVLDPAAADQISGVIELANAPVGVIARSTVATARAFSAAATVGEAQRLARESGELRVLLHDPSWEAPRVAHIRDTLTLDPGSPVAAVSRPVVVLSADTTVKEALVLMRAENAQLAAVTSEDGAGRVQTVLKLDDILGRLWPSTKAIYQG